MSVVVTVAVGGGAGPGAGAGTAGASADLELDAARPVEQLLPGLAVALGVPCPAGLLTAAGLPPDPSATLEGAGVRDGERLTLTTQPRPGPDDAEAPVLACYLALDTSDSMSGAPLAAAGAELTRLTDAVRDDPRLATTCRLAVVTFDAEARVHQPLTPVADLPRPPRLAATRPATDYAAVFILLRRQIAADLAALRSAGLRPVRPAVFLLTDGRPTRGYWPPAHATLTDADWPDAPDVVAFGFGDAAEPAVRRIGTAGAYLAAPGPDGRAAAPAGLLATFVSFLLASLTAGSHASSLPRSALALPRDAPRGWRALPGRHREP